MYRGVTKKIEYTRGTLRRRRSGFPNEDHLLVVVFLRVFTTSQLEAGDKIHNNQSRGEGETSSKKNTFRAIAQYVVLGISSNEKNQ